MRNAKASLLCLYTALVLAAAGAGVAAVLHHEPHFYRNGRVEAGPERQRLSTKFVVDFAQLLINVKAGDPNWHFTLQEDEINSFFQEAYASSGDVESLRKLGISEPRIAFEKDSVRFAFRYGSGFWSTVVSYELRIWALPKEANVLAVEIRGRRIGALPISSQGLLSDLTVLAASHNIEITAYRHEGNPVAARSAFRPKCRTRRCSSNACTSRPAPCKSAAAAPPAPQTPSQPLPRRISYSWLCHSKTQRSAPECVRRTQPRTRMPVSFSAASPVGS